MRKLASIAVLAALCGCGRNGGIPEPGSKNYRDLLSNFYVGLAALQAGEDVRAKKGLTLASQIAPGEPATFANLAVLELRQQQYEQAAKDAETARTLAPDNSQVEALLGLIESRRGNLTRSIEHLERAVKLDGKNDKARYELAQEIERQGTPGANGEAREQLRALLQRQPNNTAVLLDQIRLSAKLGDASDVNSALVKLAAQSGAWPDGARRQLSQVETAAAANVRTAAVQVQFLRNVLVRDAAFRQSLDAIRPPAGTVGEPFLRFVKIESPSSLPSPPDLAMKFTQNPDETGHSTAGATWAGSLLLEAKAEPRLIWADAKALHTESGATLPIGAQLNRHSVASGDLNYDFRSDLVIATAKGVRIYQQGLSPLFSDVTARTKLPAEIVDGAYNGAWLFDVDLDGDLDIVLGATSGPPVVLRNNADGTYAVLRPFSGVEGVIDFVAADIDGDGDPDVAMVGGDRQLHVFSNERLGNYRQRTGPALGKRLTSVAAGDVNGDGSMDFVALAEDGTMLRSSDADGGRGWNTATLLKAETGAAGLVLADVDNNGSLDAVIGKQVFLSDGKTFQPQPRKLDGLCQTVFDLNGDGQLDIVTLTGDRGLQMLMGHGTRRYGWQTIRTRASQTTGDQRINSYGVGGEIELRSGLLTQKAMITSPMTHFGLGDNTEASLARIVWPNGALQVEFDLKRDTTALAQQRLKGSCPFLFAWDGKRMRFVKDCPPWSPALGLHVNAQKVAGIGQTEEWFKIPGEALQPRDGYYDFRITAEYWETFYIDHYSLLAVDHAVGTEVFTDERFAVPAPPLRLYATGQLRAFEKAVDDRGNDVSTTVANLDSRYLDTFGRGRYQGVTRDHWVELTMPADAPQSGPMYLIGSGWLHPTDATVNVALGQSSEATPHGLSVEVPGANGKWQVAKQDLGFPAGRLKNVVLDLAGIFKPGCGRRLRLRTNLEIYWDRLAWAPGFANNQLRVQHLGLSNATLNYRGFSRMSQANQSSPELPDYDEIEQRGPRWRDLEGYYTRFGDVRPLLEKTDDRMLITNAGDEMRLHVKALPQQTAGWVRDFVLIGDGWIKDGDYNCTFSRTVLPLPYHGLHEYDRAPSELEDDPAYRLHPEDWRDFHTRYVGPELFGKALWQ